MDSSESLDKSVLSEALSNISEILTQARAVTIKNPDGSLSFKIMEIVPDSIYAKLGIENEDTITQINGEKIKSVNEVMKYFGNIKNMDQLNLSIKRNGVESNKNYNFK